MERFCQDAGGDGLISVVWPDSGESSGCGCDAVPELVIVVSGAVEDGAVGSSGFFEVRELMGLAG